MLQLNINPVKSMTVAPAAANSETLILRDADVKHLIVYGWERDGVFMNAWPGDGTETPYDAARLEVQIYKFPTGHLRRLYFTKGTNTHWHINKDDSIIYNVDVHQVEFVDTQTFLSHPGDVSLHPDGVMHHSEAIQSGQRCEFSFKPQGKSGRDLIALPGRDMTFHAATDWVEDGERKLVYGKTDRSGGKFTAKIFAFPNYFLIEAHYPKGETLPLHKNATEKLIFVVSGRLKVTTDTLTEEVGAGDMVRLAVGRDFARQALEDSVVLEIDGSKAPGSA
jgi:quercetin dioxygenase-like cupin family protein